jgi:hypothetical protein
MNPRVAKRLKCLRRLKQRSMRVAAFVDDRVVRDDDLAGLSSQTTCNASGGVAMGRSYAQLFPWTIDGGITGLSANGSSANRGSSGSLAINDLSGAEAQ